MPNYNFFCFLFQLNEPAGICANPDGSCLYIADTNNHTIKILSLTDHSLREVRFFM